jgi:hypothetical protein
MNKGKSAQIAFLIMGMFLVEIMGLIQAVFSQQVIKYHLEMQIENASETLLNQFMVSYSLREEKQAKINDLNKETFDDGLIMLYKSFSELANVKKDISKEFKKESYVSVEQLYQIDILPNSGEFSKHYGQRMGVDMSTIKDYKILSYETRDNDRLVMNKHVLMGFSKDRKWIIRIEIDQSKIQKKLDETNQKMAGLFNYDYYFTEKTGNFYVFTANGKTVYQGGLEKNADYFNGLELATSHSVLDLIRQEKDLYQRVIYKKGKTIKHSLVRSIYDEEKSLYYVFEVDEKQALGHVETKIKQIWMMGLSLLLLTFLILYSLWNYSKKNEKEYLQ